MERARSICGRYVDIREWSKKALAGFWNGLAKCASRIERGFQIVECLLEKPVSDPNEFGRERGEGVQYRAMVGGQDLTPQFERGGRDARHVPETAGCEAVNVLVLIIC